ncbi:protein ENHANCED DOWNY MILDEW 2-like isoform X2 [Rhodamnia argentea]|uniref:Protein ENHANCED DOWNY MILDEW 2-like isoform X2 n=1 Tax=Rhodamnia argentea TaxID=178133 RepID=A0ABM3GTL0_9MYRT|nr:protein ENHANCED DOWNY MILDEW 2-like isoform X2 [Rhodamnia argentea]
MESSDEEGEILPHVTDYHLIDHENKPVSFSVLPLLWSDDDISVELQTQVHLRGMVDDGLQHICKEVTAWKYELSYVHPEIYVLSKDKRWLQLDSPKKSFHQTIRTILVTVYSLHFAKKSPQESYVSMWSHLQNLKAFRRYDVKPSHEDLLDHVPLIMEAAKRDKDLAKSVCLVTFLEEHQAHRLSRKDIPAERKSNFIVANNDNGGTLDSQDESEEEFFDTMCAICDDGGKVLACEGRCMRSFHATLGAGINSSCKTLGFIDDAQVEAIPRFFCNNCKYKMHQCFACGELGSSDSALGAEVFPCISATCGHFYHPECVSQLIHRGDERRAQKLKENIAAGESFTCPVHKCVICRQGEDKEVHELQFAVCRRCPKAYHRKCLPLSISFMSDGSQNIIQRAWEGFLPKRILIYCRESSKIGATTKVSRIDAVKKSLTINKSLGKKGGKFIVKRSSQEDSVSSSKSVPYLEKKRRKIMPSSISDRTVMEKERNSASSAMEDRMLAFIEQASCEFNAERLAGKQSISASHAPGSKFILDKTITLSKVEGFVKAIRTALQKLEEGCAIEEAKEICEPGILRQILIWKKKLKVYLGPFIHGPRYTSFGRHFTKVEKLQEIVNRLQWYVQNGDTIVDFCCGSNEFSCLMKEKLDKIGKCCFFKNYDLFPPKILFQFEKRDWMSVNVEELPDGSQLIMGLNPPFGVNASLANQFIKKALTFKPKLLILIVPRETKRLDIGADPYDLLWEDCELLSGKSFYLPGSIDVHNKRLEDWNLTTPPLYLWSRHDWTSKHKTIAEEHGHISKQEYVRHEETNAGAAISNYLMEENYDCYQDYSSAVNANNDLSSIFDDFPDDDAIDGVGPLIANSKSFLECVPPVAFENPMAKPQAGFWNLQPNHHGHVPTQSDHHRAFEVPGMRPPGSFWNLQSNHHGHVPTQSHHHRAFEVPGMRPPGSFWNQPNSHGSTEYGTTSLHLGGIALPNQQSASQPFGYWPRPSSCEQPPQFPF